MKLKEKTIKKLGAILKEDYGVDLKEIDLENMAYSLVGYFNLLATGYVRNEVRK